MTAELFDVAKAFYGYLTDAVKERSQQEKYTMEKITDLLAILRVYEKIYERKRNSKTYRRIVQVTMKVNPLADFYKENCLAGTYLAIQLFISNLSVDDFLYTIVTPRGDEFATRQTRGDCASVLNLVETICILSEELQKDNKFNDMLQKYKAKAGLGKVSKQDVQAFTQKLAVSVQDALINLDTLVKVEAENGGDPVPAMDAPAPAPAEVPDEAMPHADHP